MTHSAMHAEDIGTGERQRKEFKDSDLRDLADSILRVGLIHAPVVNRVTGNLVAGERRIRALSMTEGQFFLYGDTEYEYPDIPVHFITRDDPNLVFEIELEENLRRVNLTTMEEAQAIAKLHNLRVEDRPDQTVRDTAKELAKIEDKGYNASDDVRVANSILVDQFKDDPDIQKAAKTSLTRAAKMAKKKLEIQFTRTLGALEGATEHSLFNLIQGDAREVVKSIEVNSFDILLFDPPYGTGADSFGDQAFGLGHQYEDSFDFAVDFIGAIARQGQIFLKEQAHVLMFCSYENFEYWRQLYERLGYEVWRRPLIWSKGTGHAPIPDRGPKYSYECMLLASRGKRQVVSTISDVFHFPPPREKIHAAEKPAELIAALLAFLANPGDKVLDPCVGSGSIFAGARDREIYVTGIEESEDYFAVAQRRMNDG